MTTVKKGDRISIHYTGKLEDGTVFDSSESRGPLEFTVGAGEVIPGLEDGIIGMKPGESKTIRIPMEMAYGPRFEERVFQLGREKVPQGLAPEIGQQLQMYRADGMPITVTVVGISENSLTMDCNHPLAGKALVFDTKLVNISPEH